MLLAAEGEPLSSLVTVMARNGTDFGIQVASMPGRWFVGPGADGRGLYFPGFTAADANPDIGDSAITETAGIGGFAMAAAPAIVQFVGGTRRGRPRDHPRDGPHHGRRATRRSPIPALGFAGTPTGIDVRQVEELNLLPTINTGIAHRDARRRAGGRRPRQPALGVLPRRPRRASPSTSGRGEQSRRPQSPSAA